MPDDAEVYIVLEGSTLVHVTRAQSDVMLCFIVPGMCVSVGCALCHCAIYCMYVFISPGGNLSSIKNQENLFGKPGSDSKLHIMPNLGSLHLSVMYSGTV